MEKKDNPKAITLDAKGKILGRLATQAAFYLQGKHLPRYEPHKDIEQVVRITNISDIKVTGNKEEKKMYYRHSGYPGGLRERTYKEQFERDPKEIMRRAVFGMLPKNRLRSNRMTRLNLEV